MTDHLRALETTGRAAGRPAARPADLATDHVYVLFTSFEETLTAVRVASRLARALGSRLVVVHFRPVQFGAPLEHGCGMSPAESGEFRRRLEAEGCDAEVRVCVCRDARAAVAAELKGRCLLLLGRRRRWWPSTADRWRRTLEAAGHLVVVVDEAAHA